MSNSQAADMLLLHLRAIGAESPEQEYRFYDSRRWAFDFAWPQEKLAVEIDGGNHLVRNGRAVGRHTKSSDYDKLNAAALLGWRVLRFTPEMVKSGEAIATIERAMHDVPLMLLKSITKENDEY